VAAFVHLEWDKVSGPREDEMHDSWALLRYWLWPIAGSRGVSFAGGIPPLPNDILSVDADEAQQLARGEYEAVIQWAKAQAAEPGGDLHRGIAIWSLRACNCKALRPAVHDPHKAFRQKVLFHGLYKPLLRWLVASVVPEGHDWIRSMTTSTSTTTLEELVDLAFLEVNFLADIDDTDFDLHYTEMAQAKQQPTEAHDTSAGAAGKKKKKDGGGGGKKKNKGGGAGRGGQKGATAKPGEGDQANETKGPKNNWAVREVTRSVPLGYALKRWVAKLKELLRGIPMSLKGHGDEEPHWAADMPYYVNWDMIRELSQAGDFQSEAHEAFAADGGVQFSGESWRVLEWLMGAMGRPDLEKAASDWASAGEPDLRRSREMALAIRLLACEAESQGILLPASQDDLTEEWVLGSVSRLNEQLLEEQRRTETKILLALQTEQSVEESEDSD
jgi:hypothetical protein